MVKLVIEDDCLAPSPYMEIKYKGPNPFRVYPLTPGILKNIFVIRGKDIWEREFRWDITGDPRGFYVHIIVKKTLDAYTKIFAEIMMMGKQPTDPTKEGEILIRIGGKIHTKFGGNTIFSNPKNPLYKLFLALYYPLYYAKIRRMFLMRCQEYLMKLKKTYMQILGLKEE